jgi:hypothetical protein
MLFDHGVTPSPHHTPRFISNLRIKRVHDARVRATRGGRR